MRMNVTLVSEIYVGHLSQVLSEMARIHILRDASKKHRVQSRRRPAKMH